MNRVLRRLLAQAGYERALSPDVWSSVIVVHNFGSVPLPSGLPPDFAQKGFKMLLLDGRGRPTHFARCGATGDKVLARESAVLETLCRHPELARIIPQSRSASSPVIRVQVSSYIRGRSYGSFVRREDPATWARVTSEIIEVGALVSRCAAAALPELLPGGELVDLANEAAAGLGVLREVGIAGHYLDVLKDGLRDAPPLRRELQHGDLWAGNAILSGGSWWLIDFAEFGHVQVPMYDVFHMLQTTPGRDPHAAALSWLSFGAGAVEDEWTEAARGIVALAAQRRGLTPQQVGAAFVFYLVHVSAYRSRGGVPREYREPFVRELRRVADLLRSGVPLTALTTG